MSAGAWNDTGKCVECRRNKFCKKQCSANKRRIQTIAELSLAQFAGKRGIARKMFYAENARERLCELRKFTGEDVSAEQVDAIFDRCKWLAAHSVYSVQAIIAGVYSTVHTLEITTEQSVAMMENQYGKAVAQGE